MHSPSSPKDAPLTMSQSDAQTEGGHAMVEFDNVPFIPELEPRSEWMQRNCQQLRANIKTHVSCHRKPAEKWKVDVEANLGGAQWEVGR